MAKDEGEYESRLRTVRRRAMERGMIIRKCRSDESAHEMLYDLMDHPNIEHRLQTKWAECVTLDELEATFDELGSVDDGR